jgi:lipopolysaccharide/colanic/teichoic acid biosynthesis glycosyltransferase
MKGFAELWPVFSCNEKSIRSRACTSGDLRVDNSGDSCGLVGSIDLAWPSLVLVRPGWEKQSIVPAQFLTPIGGLLRRTSLDELPQLWSIIRGQMSFVGPRPALFNQHDLIALRTSRNVHLLTPGLTGWAQINGRDELPIPAKVDLDVYYLTRKNLWLDIKIIFLTVGRVLQRHGVTH